MQKTDLSLSKESVHFLEMQVKDYQNNLEEVSEKLALAARQQSELFQLRDLVKSLEQELNTHISQAETKQREHSQTLTNQKLKKKTVKLEKNDILVENKALQR